MFYTQNYINVRFAINFPELIPTQTLDSTMLIIANFISFIA